MVEYPESGTNTLTVGNTEKATMQVDAEALGITIGWVVGATEWSTTFVLFEKGESVRQVKARVSLVNVAFTGQVMMPLPSTSEPLAWARKDRSFLLESEKPVG